jgi:hypothetical protein
VEAYGHGRREQPSREWRYHHRPSDPCLLGSVWTHQLQIFSGTLGGPQRVLGRRAVDHCTAGATDRGEASLGRCSSAVHIHNALADDRHCTGVAVGVGVFIQSCRVRHHIFVGSGPGFTRLRSWRVFGLPSDLLCTLLSLTVSTSTSQHATMTEPKPADAVGAPDWSNINNAEKRHNQKYWSYV